MRRNAKIMINPGISESLSAPIEFPCDGYITGVELQFIANIGSSPLSESPFVVFFGDLENIDLALQQTVLSNSESAKMEADLSRRGFTFKFNQMMFRKESSTSVSTPVARYYVLDPKKRYKPWSMFLKGGKKYYLRAFSDGEEPFQDIIMKFAFLPKKGAHWKQYVQEATSFNGVYVFPYDMQNVKFTLNAYMGVTGAAKDNRLFAHIIRQGMNQLDNIVTDDIDMRGTYKEPYAGEYDHPFSGHDILWDKYIYAPANEGFVMNNEVISVGSVKAGDMVVFTYYDIDASSPGSPSAGSDTVDWSYRIDAIISKSYFSKEAVFTQVSDADTLNYNMNDLVGGFFDV